ncbi:meiosis regulator and mRNA stability factor 1 isoform X1 [Maniola hyperantus]|uniref:meiosis regulator and mRNA stability factor 1 isoform X1 n=1 Tax=Aphantopus hyperantus TaxID=2795564 RepID=UPI00156A348D|nr:meiosis regulator and mRNA stability factor 1 [Maniola hyperantus]
MALSVMSPMKSLVDFVPCKESRSRSAQGLASNVLSPSMKIPLPPRLWITDFEDESSDEMCGSMRDDGSVPVERPRVRSRFRHHKQRGNASVPIGIFWDIENCQVPRGCSAIDVVAAIRAKFLTGRREADFVVVCDVRKETPHRLQELNDAQVNLIHVCGTQKNAADEKLRQCMRRFGELHTAPAALLLISGDINFAADLSDFRHRKNMEVILVHKQNTSSALKACASNHCSYNDLIAHVPRNPKVSQTEEEEEPTCEMEVLNLPIDQTPERVSRRLRRLSDNCGGKVLRVTASTAMLRFPTPDHASRALKRMDGEDVFGRKIGTRFARSTLQPTYSSDEGYSTAPQQRPPPQFVPPQVQSLAAAASSVVRRASSEWALALQQLPTPSAPPMDFCPPPAPIPRKIRGTHGSSLDRSGCSSSNSGDDSRRDLNQSRAGSPWNSSVSFSEQSEGEGESPTELTVTNLPTYEPKVLQDILLRLFNQYVRVTQVSIWTAGDGPLATVVLRSEWDARLLIARLHKRRLENRWGRMRLELSLGRPSPAPNLDVLRVRLRAILLDQKNYSLPLLRLRDAYASRYCCALTTSDLAKLKDTVVIHEALGRMVQLVDIRPLTNSESEETPWKCHIHAVLGSGHEDGSRILQPVFMKLNALAVNIQMLLEAHGGIVPLLSFVECYEAMFPPLTADCRYGVTLELLLRSLPSVQVKDSPSRHLTWGPPRLESPTYSLSESSRSSGDRDRPRTAPVLEPMLALFERELIDLLRRTPRCCISFSKLIPAFHHHFGRQCRVADYGFTKLPDLLAALSNSIVVLGSGSYRVVTISAGAQNKRWTSDLIKILNHQPGGAINVQQIPELYQTTIGRPFNTIDYGVCTIEELLEKVAPESVDIAPDGTIRLPRKVPTSEDVAQTKQFAIEAVELLCYTPNLRMEFSRFVPAYHAHYNRQLRVSNYGCTKLLELFDLIADAVTVHCDPSGERIVRVVPSTARAIMARRLSTLVPVELADLSTVYAAQYGAPPLPDTLDVSTLEALVYAAGGVVEGGTVFSAEDLSRWASSALAACAVLSSDRSIARSSTKEYFVTAFHTVYGTDPNLNVLTELGVLETFGEHVRLTAPWRTVWRLALIVAGRSISLPDTEIFIEYSNRYGPSFPNFETEGVQAVSTFLRQYSSVFAEDCSKSWRLARWVKMPPKQDIAPVKVTLEDYAVYDTPPGHKGSRVFESPKKNIWCSPPASALPAPTALLSDTKRRTRLAAQFDAA